MDRLRGWVNLPALLAVLLWGTVFPASKFALADFPAFAFVVARPLIAALLLFGWLVSQRRSLAPQPTDWPRFLAAGLLGMAVFQLFTWIGLRYTSTTHNVLLYTSSAVIGVLILWLTRQTRPTAMVWLGVALGFVGVVLIVQPAATDTETATWLGDALTLIGALGWVGVTTIPPPLVARYGPLFVTAWLNLIAGLALAPLALGDIVAVLQQPPSLGGWFGLLYVAVFGMIIASALWQYAAHRIGARQTLVYVYLEPLTALLLAVFWLGERLEPIQLVGALALLIGVGLAQR